MAVASAQYAFQNLGGAGIDFLMGHKWWHIDEVARSRFGGELQFVTPAHAGFSFDDVNDAFQWAVVVCASFGIGMNGHGASP